jgi:hypothetical protein
MSKKKSRQIAELRQRVEALEAVVNAEPVTVNVYPGGLVTRADVARSIHEALGVAAREGSRVPASMLRERGQS